MQNTIIIIESPNKVEKIEKYTHAKVYATKGHFKKLTQNFLNDYESYEPIYEFRDSDTKKKMNYIFNECKNKEVIIATDPDREGYAIAYMFYESIKNIAKSIKRAEFFEITESGIKKGLENAVSFANSNLNEFNAYKARAVGDKLVGFILSPKYINMLNDKNISIGRVQTPALNLIVKKELEIKAFNNSKEAKQLSYKLKANLKKDEIKFNAINDNIFESKEEAENLINELSSIKEAIIFDKNTKEVQTKPKEPLRTSQLQEEANKKFKFSSQSTMALAQTLFEKGLITYHRTDSNALSNEFIEQMQEKFKNEEWYEKREYKAGNQSQANAHEAIRISHIHDIDEIKEIVKNEKLSNDEEKLYRLIFANSLCSQAKNAINENTIYDISIKHLSFKAKTTKNIYKGFKGIFDEKESEDEKDKENQELDLNLNKNDKVELESLELVEVKKIAPKHYKESNFISLLEKEKIGRPSTYASFLPILLKRDYVKIDEKSNIIATQKGIELIDKITQNDEYISTSEYTAQMENVLDLISKNECSYLDFIKPLHEKLGFAKINEEKANLKPSEKQIEYAKKIAEKLNLELPKDLENDFKTCKDFIEKNKDKMITPPSEKQIELAKKLANEKKVELPKDYDKDMKICSKFIDEMFKKNKK